MGKWVSLSRMQRGRFRAQARLHVATTFPEVSLRPLCYSRTAACGSCRWLMNLDATLVAITHRNVLVLLDDRNLRRPKHCKTLLRDLTDERFHRGCITPVQWRCRVTALVSKLSVCVSYQGQVSWGCLRLGLHAADLLLRKLHRFQSVHFNGKQHKQPGIYLNDLRVHDGRLL